MMTWRHAASTFGGVVDALVSLAYLGANMILVTRWLVGYEPATWFEIVVVLGVRVLVTQTATPAPRP